MGKDLRVDPAEEGGNDAPGRRANGGGERVGRGRAGERGAIGGLEALPFSVLIFVFGSLLLVNAWGVVDAKLAVTSASREATRTFAESNDPATGACRRLLPRRARSLTGMCISP